MKFLKKLFGCKCGDSVAPLEPKKCDREITYHAVLRELHARHDIDWKIGDSVSRIEQRNLKIEEIREWAKQIPNKMIRSQYFLWLDHFKTGNEHRIKNLLARSDEGGLLTDYDTMTTKIKEHETYCPLPRYGVK